MDKRIEREIFPYLPKEICDELRTLNEDIWKTTEEIRIRAEKNIKVTGRADTILSIIPSGSVLQNILLKVCENSIYAYQDDIRNGFITIKGGHRIGLAGRVVMEDGSVKYIKDISAINIRIARQVKGCARYVLPAIVDGQGEIYNTLIISPPQCGKTTVLRELARCISDGIGIKSKKVGIVDERSEIAACFHGIAQNDIGANSDVIDCCPKGTGMEILLRSMSPNVIVTDEIGNSGDSAAVQSVVNAGVKVIATAHGYDIEEMMCKYEVAQMIKQKIFERIVVLGNHAGPGSLVKIVNAKDA